MQKELARQLTYDGCLERPISMCLVFILDTYRDGKPLQVCKFIVFFGKNLPLFIVSIKKAIWAISTCVMTAFSWLSWILNPFLSLHARYVVCIFL